LTSQLNRLARLPGEKQATCLSRFILNLGMSSVST
jgi:hypothetical protein